MSEVFICLVCERDGRGRREYWTANWRVLLRGWGKSCDSSVC